MLTLEGFLFIIVEYYDSLTSKVLGELPQVRLFMESSLALDSISALLLFGSWGLEALALSHTDVSDSLSRWLLDEVFFHKGTKLSTLEALKGLILKIPGAITLSLFTTVDLREEGAEFEVTGFDKACVSSILGRPLDFGKGVTE
ncbi:hypothetical protein Tco_0434773 [Tanacetum coccineum]